MKFNKAEKKLETKVHSIGTLKKLVPIILDNYTMHNKDLPNINNLEEIVDMICSDIGRSQINVQYNPEMYHLSKLLGNYHTNLRKCFNYMKKKAKNYKPKIKIKKIDLDYSIDDLPF